MRSSSLKKSEKNALLMEVLICTAAQQSEQNLDDGLLELSYFVRFLIIVYINMIS